MINGLGLEEYRICVHSVNGVSFNLLKFLILQTLHLARICLLSLLSFLAMTIPALYEFVELCINLLAH
jgi:hypothetical protein